jgi:hypothetical protein
MFRLEKVQEPSRKEFVYKRYNVPNIEYTVKPIVDQSGRILNKKEYYSGIKNSPVEQTNSYPVENTEYFRIKNDYVTMINAFRESNEDQFIGGMPVQMQKDCIKQLFRTTKANRLAYSVTLKVDGERFLMMVGLDSQVVFIDRSTNIFYLVNSFGERVRFPGIKAPFLLDGELVKHQNGLYEYLVFDLLFYPNKANRLTTYMYQNYEYRYIVAHECVSLINKYRFDGFQVSLKQWFPITEIFNTKNFYQYIIDATNGYRKKRSIPELNADGLIFQPNDGPYIPFREWNGYNNVQFKWKPPEELTIDFKIQVVGDHWVLLTKTDQQFMVNQPKDSKGNNVQPVPAMCYPSKSDFNKYKNFDIVEFKYQHKNNPQKNLFQPVRLRNEKSANSYATVMSTLDVIYNPFYIDDLRECFEIVNSPRISTPDGIRTLMSRIFSKSDLILFGLYKTDLSFFTKAEVKGIKRIYSIFSGIEPNEFGSSVADEAPDLSELPEVIQLPETDPQTIQEQLEKEFAYEDPPVFFSNLFRPTQKGPRKPEPPKKPKFVPKHNKNFELEFRIFNYTTTPKINMTKSVFFYLLDFCWQNFPMRTYDSIDIILNDNLKKEKKRSTYVNLQDIKNRNPIQNIVKNSIDSFVSKPSKPNDKLYNNLTFKLDLSSEEHTSEKIGLVGQINEKKVTNFIRVKSRKSFKVNDLWQIDLTRIKSSWSINDVLEKNETFECECEYIGPGSQDNNAPFIPFEEFLESINKLYLIILSNSGYC